MKISELLNLTPEAIKTLKVEKPPVFRGTQDYKELFTYLTDTDATELCQKLSEIPLGHAARGRVVDYYSKLNEERKNNREEITNDK